MTYTDDCKAAMYARVPLVTCRYARSMGTTLKSDARQRCGGGLSREADLSNPIQLAPKTACNRSIPCLLCSLRQCDPRPPNLCVSMHPWLADLLGHRRAVELQEILQRLLAEARVRPAVLVPDLSAQPLEHRLNFAWLSTSRPLRDSLFQNASFLVPRRFPRRLVGC